MTTLVATMPTVNLDCTPFVDSDSAGRGFCCLPASRRAGIHEAAVAEIVGMISAKYAAEGTRNFAIGKRAFEHAQWLKGNTPEYQSGDFDSLMKQIRDGVRMYVPITPK